ncbi:MAG: GDYXXLXY domain-containing protein, partial [Deltaproteobacteria bacterium]|nr:GDYXXLXY domain-containing protein [Deltaproteobacteria bacterium]
MSDLTRRSADDSPGDPDMPAGKYAWDMQLGPGYRLGGQIQLAGRLRALFLDGRLKAGLYAEGLAHFGITPDRRDWGIFFGRALSLAGMLLLLAGIFMFLAWNWQSFPKFLKFALCEALFAGCGLLALAGRKRWISGAAALGAAIAGGVMLAQYGQTYQTGANSWELFRAWCLLSLPFFLLRRESSLGLLLWLTASLWVALRQWPYFSYSPDFFSPYADNFTLFQIICWALCETLHQLGRPEAGWNRSGESGLRRALFPPFDPLRWLTRCLGAVCLLLLSGKFCMLLLMNQGWGFYEAPFSPDLIALLYALTLGALFFFYYLRKPDLFFLSLGVFSLAGSAGVRLLIWMFASDLWRSSLTGALFLSGLGILLLCLGAAKVIFLLRRNILARQARLADPADSCPRDQAAGPVLGHSLLDNWMLWRSRATAALGRWLSERAELPEEQIAAFFSSEAAKQGQSQPWYMKALLAFGVWLGSLLLLVAFLAQFYPLGDLTALWLALCALGAWLARNPRFAARQLGLVLIFCGLGGIFVQYLDRSHDYSAFLSLLCAVFLGLWLALPQIWARAICFALFLGALYPLYLLERPATFFMLAAFFTPPAFFSALRLADWPPRQPGRSLGPLDSALGQILLDSAAGGCLLFLLVMALAGVSLPQAELLELSGLLLSGWQPAWGICAGLAAACLLTAVNRPDQRLVRLAGGAALAALSLLFAPLGPGLGLLLYARSRNSLTLSGAACAYLGAAVSLFYYQMEISFQQKSLLLALSGLFLLGLSLAARKLFQHPAKTQKSGPGRTFARRGSLALAAVLLLILGAFNTAVFSKENLLRHGRIMLLELAPLDPLSLLQGYYMRLDLEVERQILREL